MSPTSPTSTVETVRGSVEAGELGPTLMHEHVFVLATEHEHPRRHFTGHG